MDGVAVQWNFTEEEDRTVLVGKDVVQTIVILFFVFFKGTLSPWDVFIQ